jgi:hypothetical protein
MLTYKDDVDLNAKLVEWKNFYNLSRPRGAFWTCHGMLS